MQQRDNKEDILKHVWIGNMNYTLIVIGVILSFLSYRWSFYYMCNPNYYRLKGRSEVTQLWFETMSNVIFFGGYGLIIFSSGFRLSMIGIGFVIVLLLHIVLFPMFITRIKRIKQNEPNNQNASEGC